MRIFNGTPHDITIISTGYTFDTAIRKYTAEKEDISVVATIPSNVVLSAAIATQDAEPVDGIPVFTKVIRGADPLPDGYDIYIVSALYVSAYRQVNGNTDKLYTVADPVYTKDGKTILGSRGIAPAF